MKSSVLLTQSIAAAGLGALLAGSASAQATLYEFTGSAANDRLGASAATAGDLNGDGSPEFLVGAPQDGNAFFASEGRVELRDGSSGSVLASWSGVTDGDGFGTAVDGGHDVDLDGVPDIAVGAPFFSGTGIQAAGRVTLISGATYTVLGEIAGTATLHSLGRTIALVGDLDGDGRSEVMAGSSEALNGRGLVRVYRYTGGGMVQLYQFVGGIGGARLGISLDGISDVNADGVPDLLVGSAFDGYYIYSGADGSELRHTYVPSEATLGTAVCALDDLNGDGVEEIVAGAVQGDIFNPGSGKVYVKSGLTDATLFTVAGAAGGDRFGMKVADAGDWNADGKNDFLVTSDPNNGPNFVTLHSGVDGTLLSTFQPDAATDNIGTALAGLGDLDGDNKVEILLGAPEYTQAFNKQGLARIYTSPFEGCGGVISYCGNATANSSGSAATLSAIGSTSVGDQALILQATGVVPNGFGLFYYGPNQVNLPAGNGVRCVGGSTVRLSPTQAQGTQVLKSLFLDPNAAGITGNTTWNFQYWYRDIPARGAQFNFSDAIEIRFCN